MTKISISQLGVLDYCEYKIYFRDWMKKQKKKISSAPTTAMKEGLKAHKELKEVFEEVDTAELLKKRELSVSYNILRGRMDEIKKSPNQIIIYEDKRHDNIYEGDKHQVLAYCYTYINQHNIEDTEVIGVVRNWITGKEIWRKVYTEEDGKMIEKKAKRILGILNGSIQAISTDNYFKCKRCNLKTTCDKSLYSNISVEDFLK